MYVRTVSLASLSALVLITACVSAQKGASKTDDHSTRQEPYADWRAQAPGKTHHIKPSDLPQPFESPSVDNDADVIPRPKDAWPQAPAGFKVELYAENLDRPRLIRTAPNGD